MMHPRRTPRFRLWHLPVAVALSAPPLAIGTRLPGSLPALGLLGFVLVPPAIGMAYGSDGDFRRYFPMGRSRPGTVEVIPVRCLWAMIAWFLAFTIIVNVLAAMGCSGHLISVLPLLVRSLVDHASRATGL